MEDIHVISLDARSDKGTSARISFFGIWDGHGGVDSAKYASENLHDTAIKAGLLRLKVGALT